VGGLDPISFHAPSYDLTGEIEEKEPKGDLPFASGLLWGSSGTPIY